MESTQPIVVQLAPADVDPERIGQITELGLLLLVGAVSIYCLKQLLSLFEVHHDRD